MKNILGFLLIFILLILSSCAEERLLCLWYERPATKWFQALPIGNGRLGAMIYGGIETETIELNEVTLWSGQYDDNQEKECGKTKLDEMRKYFFEDNLAEGNRLGTEYLSGTPHSFGTHLPMGDLKVFFSHPKGVVRKYKRELNIANSLSTVEYTIGGVEFKREYFCSNPDNVLVIKFSSNKSNSVSLSVELDLLRKSDISIKNNVISFAGQALFDKQGPGGVMFLGNVAIDAKGGVINVGEDEIKVENSDEVQILIDIRTNFKNEDYIDLCHQTIERAKQKQYELLKKDHIDDYKKLFDRVKLNLGTSYLDKLPTDVRWANVKNNDTDDLGLVSLFFNYGRYLIISSSRDNSPLPANLQGIWNDNLACNMPWTCDYHLDINTQQNYWFTNVANLHECNPPLFNYIEELAKYGEKTAMKVYGAKGWTAHTVANIWGYTAPGQGVNWGLHPTAGIWIASHLWTHYEFTNDKDFLENQAYPILKKTVEFLLDYMVIHPNNGYLMTGPSISPENSFKKNGVEYCMSMMPTGDRILAYEAFDSCIKASEILGVDEDFRAKMKDAILNLPPLFISHDGTIQEWFEDYELAHPEHRHSMQLLSVYPFAQITPLKTPQLAKAADKTIIRMLNAPNFEDTEWSRANFICVYSRLKDGDKAYQNIRGLLSEFIGENLMTFSGAGVAMSESDIFSFDANQAGPAGIAEMILQSHEEFIELLPALPKSWDKGSFSGLCVRGGAEVDLVWDSHKIKYVRLKATNENVFKLKIPKELQNRSILLNGKELLGCLKDMEIVPLQLSPNDIVEICNY